MRYKCSCTLDQVSMKVGSELNPGDEVAVHFLGRGDIGNKVVPQKEPPLQKVLRMSKMEGSLTPKPATPLVKGDVTLASTKCGFKSPLSTALGRGGGGTEAID